MSKLYIYNCNDANNKMNKQTLFLTEKNVDIMSGTDCTNPVFIVSGSIDFIGVNYCFSEKFRRYYFIDNIKALENDMYALECSVDVLMTYKDYILSGEHLIERQENVYNAMLPDNNIISRVGTKTQKKVIGNVGKTISYVLTVTGGGGE